MKTDSFLDVSISMQTLTLVIGGQAEKSYRISTAKNGVGQQRSSECTPAGWHSIRAKIGADQPVGTVFIGRRPTGEIYNDGLDEQYPQRDWILTRILWLGGLEPGKNRYGRVDTAWRYIYIHGCPDRLITGKPESHGCIRMKNADIVDLFERVESGFKVLVHD